MVLTAAGSARLDRARPLWKRKASEIDEISDAFRAFFDFANPW